MPSTPSPQIETLEEAQQHVAAKRRRNFWLAVIIVIMPLFWFVPGAIYMRSATRATNEHCQHNLASLGQAMTAYAKAHNDQLPKASDWIGELKPDSKILRCPADLNPTRVSSYAMNANLGDKKLSELKDPHNTILLYEQDSKATVPFGRGEDIVRLGKDTVGLGRHHTIGYRFNFYLMADGTVRYPKNLDEVKTYKWTP
jgi:hypothetical protein